MLRSALIAVAALLTSACNMIVTPQPMYGPDAAGQPPLREGLWLAEDAECAVDVGKPAGEWPDCATWMVYRDGRFLFAEEGGDKGLPADAAVVVTGGSPRVMQVTIRGKDKGEMNIYLGLEALQHDRDGRITRYRSWTALCGPLPPKRDGEERTTDELSTREPFPGLIMDGGSCTPADEWALRNAVAASRSLDGDPQEARWIRASDR